MDIPRPSQEKMDELDGYLEQVLAEYRREPYTGLDPHGYFPYVEAIVRRLFPEWSEVRTSIMAAAATGHIAGELAQQVRATEEANAPGVTWKKI